MGNVSRVDGVTNANTIPPGAQSAPARDTTVGNDTAIVLRDVAKTYRARRGREVEALRDINLEIRSGEFVCLLGPSGCGKSTLLKMLGGLVTKSSGDIELFGRSQSGPSRDIGIVYQQPLLLPWLTVLQNILLPIRVFRMSRKKYEQHAIELINLVGLNGFEGSYPHQLSGGMQQRVGIARALITDPKILLMDEPFGALDAMTRDQLTLELLDIWDKTKKTIVFVTHNITESVVLSDRVVVMTSRPGRIARLIPVTLARPRSLDDVNTDAFGTFTHQIREVLDEQEFAQAGGR